MESIRIETTEHPLFAQLWKLYNDSFPRVERRTLEHQKTALRSELYSLLAYTDEGKFVGLVGYWEFDSYVYIEHLCVDPSLRSGGYGSRIMKHLCGSTDKTVILEIEPVVDEPTARRLRFYEKLGVPDESLPPHAASLPRGRSPRIHADRAFLPRNDHAAPIRPVRPRSAQHRHEAGLDQAFRVARTYRHSRARPFVFPITKHLKKRREAPQSLPFHGRSSAGNTRRQFDYFLK